MKNHRLWIVLIACVLMLSACSSDTEKTQEVTAAETAVQVEETDSESETPTGSASNTAVDIVEKETEAEISADAADTEENKVLNFIIGSIPVTVAWEDNESVIALRELVENGTLTINMSMYGGFEQVGSIGQSLPRNDVQTTTQAGDIVLYSGNQIVVFYGSNSWAYTRLGRITDKSAEEMRELLGNEDVTITISLSAE